MKAKNGFSELLVLIGICLVIGLIAISFLNKFIFGNKQIVDFKYNFNYAYVLGDNGKFEKIQIKAWKDWQDSDAIQVVDIDGKPIYTHLRNVKLVYE